MDDSSINGRRGVALGQGRRRGCVRPHFLDVGDIGVTDMSHLFCAAAEASTWGLPWLTAAAAASFNDDIGHIAWDTFNQDIGRHVDGEMFHYASSFNQDIGGWAFDSVTDMEDVLLRLGLRPGPRLVRGRRRRPGTTRSTVPRASRPGRRRGRPILATG